MNRLQYSDKPAWNFLTAPLLIKESGDFGILVESVQYENEPGTETALFEHLDDFRAGHPSMQSFEPQTAVLGQVLPLHPGARRYFQELGLVGRAKEE